MKTLIRSLLLVLVLAGAAAAQPALWRVADADTEIVLFGTIHMLHPDASWLDADLAARVDAADRLVLETRLDEATQARVAGVAAQNAFLPAGETLSALLTRDQAALLARAAAASGTNPAALERLRPWIASLTLALDFAQAQGQASDSGADRILFRRATASGASLSYLEAPESQVAIFAGMSQAGQVDVLVAGAREIVEQPGLIARMDRAWLAGDVETLADLAVGTMRADTPELYERAMLARNSDWAAQIEAMLARPGRVFVAVGAAHLLGPDSVQAMLAARGHASDRIR